MSYCANKSQAIIQWQFANSQKEKYIVQAPNLPVDVSIGLTDNGSSAAQSFNQSYPGQNPATYSFTINAPASVPPNLSPLPNIYLISGTWDDYGSIGSYNTGSGIVKTYSAPPLLIGSGYSVSGSVVNVQPVDCYARLNLEWRWGNCQITISSNGRQIYQKSGSCPCNYNVTCNDDCPDGYCKIDCPHYPGYCCISCAEIDSLLLKLK